MKVAIVHDFLLKLGGAERVVAVLAKMFPDAPIFCLLYDENAVGHVFPKERVRPSNIQNYPGFIRKRHRFFTTRFPREVEEFDLEGFDLVLSSSTAFAHGAITNINTKHISYCHSPMRYAWDWSNEYIKENSIRGLKLVLYRSIIKKLREWDLAAADRPDLYLANSNNVRKRIAKYYRMESEVLYPPVNVKRFKLSKNEEDYFLIVSTLTPYKNIHLAVELFNKLGKRLVIIGEGSHRSYLESIAGENIDFLGFKDDETVAEYMQNCRALIFAGEEDFGITPVEAMACGKPVLAFGKGGVTESVVSGKSGEFFFDNTVEAMEDGLGRLLYNKKFYNPETIRLEAEKFSEEEFKRKLNKIIKREVGKTI